MLQVVSNNAFAEELIKLPSLFTHYYHHAEEHKDTKDFFDYLYKHYSDHSEKDSHSKNHNDEDNECNLPFKHCGNCCINAHAPAIGFVSSHLTAEYSFVLTKSSKFFSENDIIESNDLCSIWQPPKLV